MLNKRADKLELLRIAEAVALEKSIQDFRSSVVFTAKKYLYDFVKIFLLIIFYIVIFTELQTLAKILFI